MPTDDELRDAARRLDASTAELEAESRAAIEAREALRQLRGLALTIATRVAVEAAMSLVSRERLGV